MIDDVELLNRFGFHSKSRVDHAMEHSSVRQALYDASITIDNAMPDGREKALVLTKLEEAMFWANAGIARQDDEPDSFGETNAE